MSEHATVVKDGFTVPLIGIPVEAVLEECESCHETLPLRELQLIGNQMLCRKCAKP